MTREVDGHSDPCTQIVARPTHHHRERPPLMSVVCGLFCCISLTQRVC